jgi:hypothetical protein
MTALHRLARVSLLTVSVLLTPAAGRSEADGPRKSSPPPNPPSSNGKKASAAKPPSPAATNQTAPGDGGIAEAETLRKAFILLLNGNGDYDGHRVKAMHAVREGFEAVEQHVSKHGTRAQKAAIESEKAAIRAAEAVRQRAPQIREDQGTSDAGLREAAGLLAQVKGNLVKGKHQEVLDHVNHALAEIATALKVR